MRLDDACVSKRLIQVQWLPHEVEDSEHRKFKPFNSAPKILKHLSLNTRLLKLIRTPQKKPPSFRCLLSTLKCSQAELHLLELLGADFDDSDFGRFLRAVTGCLGFRVKLGVAFVSVPFGAWGTMGRTVPE